MDVDLAWSGAENELLDTLIDAAIRDLGDFFSLTIERTAASPDRMGGAHRFRVAASLAGRLFETFLLDVGEGDTYTGEVELLTTSDLLGFAGIDQVVVPVIPLTRQAAEKLHAYTRRYEGGRPSSRTKDLVDLALIAQLFALDAAALGLELRRVFEGRNTHDLPAELPNPPADWRAPRIASWRRRSGWRPTSMLVTQPSLGCSIRSSRIESPLGCGTQRLVNGIRSCEANLRSDRRRPSAQVAVS